MRSQAEAHYSANYDLFVSIKARYDTGNVFPPPPVTPGWAGRP
jgi:hypothetical protein